MDFHAEPGFVHVQSEPRYFVRPLQVDDSGWRFGYRWQIQLLNENREGAAWIEFGPDDGTEFVRLLAVPVPLPVIEAARSGINDYVDKHGTTRNPHYMGW